jgi:hypothetical protein
LTTLDLGGLILRAEDERSKEENMKTEARNFFEGKLLTLPFKHL